MSIPSVTMETEKALTGTLSWVAPRPTGASIRALEQDQVGEYPLASVARAWMH